MEMNQKGFSNTVLIVIIAILMGVIGYLAFVKKSEPITQKQTPASTQIDVPPVEAQTQTQAQTQTSAPASLATPSLAGDHKSIIANGKTLLAIDNDAIFNFFKTKSQLCSEYNITTTPDRKMFCENKAAFKKETRFASIIVSPDKTKIGFSIESDTLSPDKVAGIFYPYRTINTMSFLTNYYIGNTFISFSPNGTYFVYQGSCFEGMCGLFIKNSETLATKIDFNNSKEGLDARVTTSEFVQWISDNKVEYKLGKELKQASF